MCVNKRIFLASKSPRRRELLEQIGIPYTLVDIDIDIEECRQQGESATDYVTRLSKEKALAGSRIEQDAPVLGADTIVVLNDEVLEKPISKEHAQDMLSALSGCQHQVMTAVTIVFNGRLETLLNTSTVSFRDISHQEIERYYVTGEPLDKAGGYGIQGLGSVFVKHIIGSYSGVMGLPIYETQQLLAAFDIHIL